MVCSLLAFKKTLSQLGFWALALSLTGCSPESDTINGHLYIKNLAINWQQQLQIQSGLELGLSDANIAALESGIPLTISVDLRLGRRYRGWAREVRTQSFHWRIRYLPLSEHYALENPIAKTTETYPRLRTLLTSLRIPNWYPTNVTIEDITDNRYQMQIRARLNRLELPAPLRLPALFSSQWRLSDSWHTLLIPLPTGIAP